MSVNSTQGGSGSGGSVLGAAVVAPTAAVVLTQTGVLPKTGASEMSIMLIAAILTFAVVFSSRVITRFMLVGRRSAK